MFPRQSRCPIEHESPVDQDQSRILRLDLVEPRAGYRSRSCNSPRVKLRRVTFNNLIVLLQHGVDGRTVSFTTFQSSSSGAQQNPRYTDRQSLLRSTLACSPTHPRSHKLSVVIINRPIHCGGSLPAAQYGIFPHRHFLRSSLSMD